MNVIELRRNIPSSPEAVWARLGDFGGVAGWNPFVNSVDVVGSGVGMTRTITATDGALILERLEVHDDAERHIRYGVELASGAQSVADIRLLEASGGTTEIVWQSIRDIEVPQAQRDVITATLDSRIQALTEAVC